jgi:hypothetical protein
LFDVLPSKFESHTAVNVVVPTLSAEVVKFAVPPLKVSVQRVLPSINATVSPFGRLITVTFSTPTGVLH